VETTTITPDRVAPASTAHGSDIPLIGQLTRHA
jgi:hypothetical protein